MLGILPKRSQLASCRVFNWGAVGVAITDRSGSEQDADERNLYAYSILAENFFFVSI